MKSLSWVVVIMVFAGAAMAQVPHTISYQGVVWQDGKAMTGAHTLGVSYYTVKGDSLLGSETFPVTLGSRGEYSVLLGSATGFPQRMDFTKPYQISVTLDGTLLPGRTPLATAPFAMNAERAGGLEVSKTPYDGKLWPVPLDGSGKIDASVLPSALSVPLSGVNTINGVTGNTLNPVGELTLVGSQSISIVPVAKTHSIQFYANPSLNLPSGKVDNLAPYTSGGPITLTPGTAGVVTSGNASVTGTMSIGSGASVATLQSGVAAATLTLPSSTGTIPVVLKGSGTLSSGAVTVPMVGCQPVDFVMVSRGSTLGAHPGNLTSVASTGIVTVTSDNAQDNGTVNVLIVRQ